MYNIFIQIRKNQDLTQTEFAQKLGVSRSLVAKIEANQQEISKNVYKKLLEKYPDEMKKYNLIDKNYTFDFVSLQELNTRLANVNMVLDDNIKLLHLLCSILYKNNYKFTEKQKNDIKLYLSVEKIYPKIRFGEEPVTNKELLTIENIIKSSFFSFINELIREVENILGIEAIVFDFDLIFNEKDK